MNISDRSRCCGCAACVQRCPQQCISLKEDKEGFWYPTLEKGKCINCGLCKIVCPFVEEYDSPIPLKVFAAKNKNVEIRVESSSGGIFSILAESVIDKGGVVFGACFDKNWDVIHDYTETKDGIAAFRGSKYVQSRIGNTYQQAEDFLKEGRLVMYTGTPCQIKGLKLFLKKEYDNLLAVDFVCHGVPSPLVWRVYLQEVVSNYFDISNNELSSVIKGINFRDKSTGWNKYSFVLILNNTSSVGEQDIILSSKYTENIFMKAFLLNLSLRPSCYNCPSKSGKSGADITLGDFWGAEKYFPDFDDDKGCSLCILYSEKAYSYIKSKCELIETTREIAINNNPCIYYSVDAPVNRNYFYKELYKGNGLLKTMHRLQDSSLFMRLRRMIYRKIGI